MIVKANDRKQLANSLSNYQNVTSLRGDDLSTSKHTTQKENSSTSTETNLNSPSAFINHHANRLKSKIITQANDNNSNLIYTSFNDSNKISNPNTISSWLKNASSPWNSTKNNLIILANSAAIELYFLCIEDDLDAEKLCNKCSEKFFLSLSLSETILQAPLIASCIQVLGRLALKYPFLSKTSVKHLTDFLTEPSPILLKQYKHILEKLSVKSNAANNLNPDVAKSPVNSYNNIPIFNGNKSAEVSFFQSKGMVLNYKIGQSNVSTQSSNGRVLSRSQTLAHKGTNASYSKSTRIFEYLRDLTIECLCL